MTDPAPLPPRSKLLQAVHPVGVLAGALVGALGFFGVLGRLDMAPDEALEIMGAAFAVIAAVAAAMERRDERRRDTAARVGRAKIQRAALMRDPPDLSGRAETHDAEADEADPEGETPDDGGGGPLILTAALVLLTALPAGCGHGGAVARTLGAVVSRVDVQRLLDCSGVLPDYGAAAKCLGAEAATQGLMMALDKAVEVAERARDASGPSGADDMSDRDRDALAADLETALYGLAVEIDATHVEG